MSVTLNQPPSHWFNPFPSHTTGDVCPDFECSVDASCVPNMFVCDGIDDCPDGEDETDELCCEGLSDEECCGR